MIDLSTVPVSDLLTAVVEGHNEMSDELDARGEEIARLRSQLDGYKRQVAEQTIELQQAKQDELRYNDMIKALAKERQNSENLQRQLNLANATNKGAQQELQQLRQMNPQKLKDQTKRVKEQNEKLTGRIDQLEREATSYKSELREASERAQQAHAKIKQLELERNNISAIGIYHKGDHHLVTWPQLMSLHTSSGEIVTQRPLLYMHQSGRGALLTLDPDTMELSMAASPKGGLRASDDALQVAGQWLYKVNQQQGTNITPDDLVVIDHNKNLEVA